MNKKLFARLGGFVVAMAAIVAISFMPSCSGDDDDDDDGTAIDCTQFETQDECTAHAACKWESMEGIDLLRQVYPAAATDGYPGDDTTTTDDDDDLPINGGDSGGSCSNIVQASGLDKEWDCETYLAEFSEEDAGPGWTMDAEGNWSYSGDTIDYTGYAVSFSFNEVVKGAMITPYKSPLCAMSGNTDGAISLPGVPVDEHGRIFLVARKKNFVPTYDFNKLYYDNEVNVINSTLANMLPNLVGESYNQETAVIAGTVYDSVENENGIGGATVSINPAAGNLYYTVDGKPNADQPLTEEDSSIFIFFAVPPAQGTYPDFAYTLNATKNGAPVGIPTKVDTFGGAITISNIYAELETSE